MSCEQSVRRCRIQGEAETALLDQPEDHLGPGAAPDELEHLVHPSRVASAVSGRRGPHMPFGGGPATPRRPDAPPAGARRSRGLDSWQRRGRASGSRPRDAAPRSSRRRRRPRVGERRRSTGPRRVGRAARRQRGGMARLAESRSRVPGCERASSTYHQDARATPISEELPPPASRGAGTVFERGPSSRRSSPGRAGNGPPPPRASRYCSTGGGCPSNHYHSVNKESDFERHDRVDPERE